MTNRSPNQSHGFWFVALQYVVCYLFWFLGSGLALWILFLLRTNLVEDLLFLRLNPWQLRAADRFFIFGMGAAWIVGVMLCEGYLRNGIENGKLWQRIGKILAVEAFVVLLSLAIHYLAISN